MTHQPPVIGAPAAPAATDAFLDATGNAGRGAPCWVSLAARDLASAEKFYGSVLGWEFRSTSLGDHFAVALSHGKPVAGIGAVASDLQVAVVWTPYFAVTQVDEAAARIRERSATVALGPVAFASGRAVVAADRDNAVFGVWDGRLPNGWETWHDQGPVVLRLRTRDAFEAAIFYGGVLQWADGKPGGTLVSYENDEVVVRSRGAIVARLSSGAVEAAPDPRIRPHWEVQFTVADVPFCIAAARTLGGTLISSGSGRGGTYAELRDPDGGRFTVVSRFRP
jgi:predicted enzyme related to lactoylglutathione lyase